MRRNWNAIHALPCRATQIALTNCLDADVLPRLQKAFPECFEEGEEKSLGTWSEIIRKALEYFIATQNNSDMLYASLNWALAFKPSISLEFGYWEGEPAKDGDIPEDVANQLRVIPHIDGSPVCVTYLEKEWVVGEAWHTLHVDHALDQLHAVCNAKSKRNYTLQLIPRNLIIFDF